MPGENTDQTEEQVAETEKQAAEQTTEAEGQQTEAETEGKAEGEEKTVPKERFEEMAAKVKQLEEQATMTAQQLALAKANPPQAQKQPQQEFDIYKECGLDPDDPDDVPTQAQIKKIFGHYGTIFSRQLADVAFHQTHPDYTQVVGTADEVASGKYAGPLAAALKKNPALLTDIANSGDPRLAAYNIAKLQIEKPKGEAVTSNEAKTAIDEAVKNANRVKSSANTKGGEALSEEGRIAKMSDEDFVKLALTNGAII